MKPTLCPCVCAALRRAGGAMAAAWLALAPTPALADANDEEEFALFRLTEVEGHVVLRATGEDLATTTGTASASQRQTNLRAELYLLTRSFVYHPNFLALEVGFGPVFEHGTARNDAAETSSGRSLYELSVRGAFLRDKPYTGSVYYEHLNPAVSVGPAQVLLQENERYGLEFALLAPATPVPLRLDASRNRSQGTSSELTVDDRTDQLGVLADVAIGRAGATQFRARHTRADSRSGSTLLPLQRTRADTRSAGLDTRLHFGTSRQFELVNLLAVESQHYALGANLPADRETARAVTDVLARASEALQLRANHRYDRDTQGPLHRTTNAGELAANYGGVSGLGASLAVSGEQTRSTPFDLSAHAVAASVRYRAELPLGAAEASYTVRREVRDQQAADASAAVSGERIVLAGVAFAELARQRVVAGSVAVWNESRSQAYVEGQDYTVSVLGTQTRLQRVVGGDITDGQAVLVDYAYTVGGSFAYSQLDQGLSLGWSLGNRASVYLRVTDARPRLESGVPLLTLNTVRSTIVGARVDGPIGTLAYAGAGIEHEARRETILPLRRSGADAYVQFDALLAGADGLRVGVRRSVVDYDFADADVDLTGWDLHYWVRLPSDVELVADLSREADRGGPLELTRELATLRARWQFRRLAASFNLTRSRETQGPLQTRRMLGQLLVRRDF